VELGHQAHLSPLIDEAAKQSEQLKTPVRLAQVNGGGSTVMLHAGPVHPIPVPICGSQIQVSFLQDPCPEQKLPSLKQG